MSTEAKEVKYQILHLEQGTPEWYEHRAKYFNSTEAAVVMGVSPYEPSTPYKLYLERKGLLTIDRDNWLTQLGKNREGFVREAVERVTEIGYEPCVVVRKAGMEIDGVPYSASLDGLPMGGNGRPLEVKNVVSDKSERWQKAKANDIAAFDFPQLEIQCMVLDVPAIDYAVANREEIIVLTYQSNPEYQKALHKACKDWWARFIADIAPEPMLTDMLPQTSPEWCAAADRYLAAKKILTAQEYKNAEAELDAAVETLKELSGKKCGGFGHGVQVRKHTRDGGVDKSKIPPAILAQAKKKDSIVTTVEVEK